MYKLNSVECQEASCRNLFRITVHEEHEVSRWWIVLSAIYILKTQKRVWRKSQGGPWRWCTDRDRSGYKSDALPTPNYNSV